MFVLGIDPGLSVCGYAVIQHSSKGDRAIAAGVIRTDPSDPVEERLNELHRDLTALASEHQLEAMAIEQLFTNRNLRTAISVGRASGVALLVAAQAGIPAFEYSPSAVKAAVAGYGAASKDQIRYAVAARLRLAAEPDEADAADALAVALCHSQQGKGMARIKAASAPGKAQ